ncbi:MAG: ATP-binding protein [Anaeromyxobacter sp.]
MPAPVSTPAVDVQELAWRAWALRLSYLILGVGVAAPALAHSLVAGNAWMAAALLAGAPLVAAGAIWGGRAGRFRAWSGLLLVMVGAVPAIGMAGVGPTPGICAGLTTLVVLAALFRGRRAAWAAVALQTLVLAFTLAGGELGWLPWPSTPPGDWSTSALWAWYLTHLLALALVIAIPPRVMADRFEQFAADREAAHREADEALGSRERAEQERSQAEAALAQAQRGAVIQRVGAALAHDFNNALVVIRCSAEALADPAASPEMRAEAGDAILACARRASALTRQLMLLARRAPPPPGARTPADVGRVLQESSRLFRQILPADVQLEVLTAGAAPAALDETALTQVLLNLVLNARDALPRGGHVRISSEPVPAAGPPSHVLLEVTDDGAGMTPEVRAHAFEPLFSSKAHGAGLGLAVSLALVRQAGGDLALRSAPGAGTTVTITLPAAAQPRAAAPRARPQAPPRGARALVVDPDEGLRHVTALALQARGFSVMEAGDASAGLERVRRLHDRLDLICLDVSEFTPGAARLAEECAALFPEVALLATGSVAEPGVAQARSFAFIAKPFVASDLAERAVGLVAREGKA